MFNYEAFVANFMLHLEQNGYYLKKSFDPIRGGHFFKTGYAKKSKAFGKYLYHSPDMTRTGDALIIWTEFAHYEKGTGKVLISHRSHNFWDKSQGKNKSKVDLEAVNKMLKKREEDERKLQVELRSLAYSEYKQLSESSLDPNEHPYIKRKNVKAERGVIRVSKGMIVESYYNQFKENDVDKTFFRIKLNDLLIPAIDINLSFVTYQKIPPLGNKMQRVDVSTIGAFYVLGEWRLSTKTIFFCEGYATGWSLYNAIKTGGWQDTIVFVCFDVANVGVVLGQILRKLPDVEGVICTDNDWKKATKAGLYKGFEYSYKYKMPFIFPKFPDNYDGDGTDWNDLDQMISPLEMFDMISNQIDSFKTLGVNQSIKNFAIKNSIKGTDLKLIAQRDKTLFSTLDLDSF